MKATKKVFILILVSMGVFACVRNTPEELDEPILSPVITSFSPIEGKIGDTITIVGEHFSNTLSQNVVKFNGEPSIVIEANTTQLKAIVPTGATTGFISVSTDASNVANSPTEFRVIQDKWVLKNDNVNFIRYLIGQETSATIFHEYNGKGYVVDRDGILEYNPIGNTWTRVFSAFIGPRYSFMIGNKIYFGNLNILETPPPMRCDVNKFWEYDINTQILTIKADFPGSCRKRPLAFTIGNKGYLGLGDFTLPPESVTSFWEYDPTTNQWTRKAEFGNGVVSTRRGVHFVSNGKVYVTALEYTKDTWEYTPEDNTWRKKADFPSTMRGDAFAFTIGNKGYVGSGQERGTVIGPYLKDFWEYNTTTDTWVRKADFPSAARIWAGSFNVNGKGYVFGGINQSNATLYDFWEYTP